MGHRLLLLSLSQTLLGTLHSRLQLRIHLCVRHSNTSALLHPWLALQTFAGASRILEPPKVLLAALHYRRQHLQRFLCS